MYDKNIVNGIATYINNEIQLPPFLEKSDEIMYRIRLLVKEFLMLTMRRGSNEFISKIDWSSLPEIYRQ